MLIIQRHVRDHVIRDQSTARHLTVLEELFFGSHDADFDCLKFGLDAQKKCAPAKPASLLPGSLGLLFCPDFVSRRRSLEFIRLWIWKHHPENDFPFPRQPADDGFG